MKIFFHYKSCLSVYLIFTLLHIQFKLQNFIHVTKTWSSLCLLMSYHQIVPHHIQGQCCHVYFQSFIGDWWNFLSSNYIPKCHLQKIGHCVQASVPFQSRRWHSSTPYIHYWPTSSWWLQMIWRQIGARSSATTVMTRLWFMWHDSYYITYSYQRNYHRGRLAPLLFLYHWQVYFITVTKPHGGMN